MLPMARWYKLAKTAGAGFGCSIGSVYPHSTGSASGASSVLGAHTGCAGVVYGHGGADGGRLAPVAPVRFAEAGTQEAHTRGAGVWCLLDTS